MCLRKEKFVTEETLMDSLEEITDKGFGSTKGLFGAARWI